MKKNYYATLKSGLITLFSVSLVSLVLLSSCKKDEESGSRFSLKDNPTSLIASSEGASETYTVQTSGAWKVEPTRNDNWVRIEPSEGVGEGTFTVTVNRNTTFEPRESVLTFVTDGKIQNTVLRIQQDPRDENAAEDDPYVNFDWMESLELPEAGINGRYAIRSTGNWKLEIVEGADWLTIEPKEGRGDAGVSVAASVNTDPRMRKARLAFYLDGVKLPGEFSINQQGMEAILFEDFNWLAYGNAVFYTTTGEKIINEWTTEEKARGWTSSPSTDGSTPLYARQGFVKLGKTNYGGDLITPKLSAVTGTQNLVVEFKAVPYLTSGRAKDDTSLKIAIIGPGTASITEFTIDNWPDYDNDPAATEIWKAAATKRSFTITGATAETQIQFLGGDFDLRGRDPLNKNRIFLDDILVSVKK